MFSKFFPNAHGSSLAPMAIGTLAVAAIAGLAGTASASVIYQDSFNGNSSTSLAGTAPNTDNGPSTKWFNQWNTAWMDNGSVVNPGNNTLEVAALDFTPAAGNIYTLSANLNPTSGGGWLTVGFTNGNGSAEPFWNTTGPWIMSYLSGTPGVVGVQTWAGPGTTNSQYNSANTINEVSQVVLDTTGTDWIARFSYGPTNSLALLATYTYTGATGSNPNPTAITQVAIGANAASGSISNFSLTAVPEPATLGLTALGGLGLLLLKRRKTV